MSSLSWVEIKREAPEHNLRELKRGAKKNIIFCAVVKSNAYGHGVKQITSILPSADWFAVNSLEEGAELRSFGIKKPILVLGYVPLNQLKEAIALNLSLTVYNIQTLKKLERILNGKKQAKIHLKIETGTSRQGIMPEEIPHFADFISKSKSLFLEGISTHYANIEDTLNPEYAQTQLKRFKDGVKIIKKTGLEPKIIHTACTAAAILYPETHFDMLRIGIGLYGLWPSRETYISALLGSRPLPKLIPVLTWKTRVAQIKTIPEGSYVGYGCTYRTTRKTRLAVLPVGYADGYDRSLGNKAHVLIRGKRAKVLGRVCMNLTMVDVTDIKGVRLEDEVVLIGRSTENKSNKIGINSECTSEESITAEMLAEWAGTINYEIVTRISPYLERRIV